MEDILNAQIKGVTVKIAWQFFAGWTSLVCFAVFAYVNIKSEIREQGLGQSRTDAIQDLRIDALKRDVELETLQIKDLNERYNELKSKP